MTSNKTNKVENVTADSKDSIPKKSKTNHITVTINKSNQDLYKEVKDYSDKIGCSVKDLIWWSLGKCFSEENKKDLPKNYGLH